IEYVFTFRDKMPNWKEVMERFMKDNKNFANFKCAYCVSAHIASAESETFPGLVKLYDVLLEEIIGKTQRRLHYVFLKDDAEPYVSLVKHCIQWRSYMPNDDWKNIIPEDYAHTVCIVDEELRKMFHPEGFVLSEDCLNDIAYMLHNVCSASFRTNCERFLFNYENVDEHNELVMKAREACRRSAKRQLSESD
ncbi:hypothetical protein MP638_001695, partial [Amoeboaphelidium occidentale]